MAETVLVVDDEPRILDLYANWLDEAYGVRRAEDGQAALEELDDDVDVVLLDRRMPGLSGDEVLQRLRDRGHDAWVVMVTAVDPDVDVVDMPFDDYLVKPVDRDDLLGAVASMFDRADHDEVLREYFETMAKLGMLEATHARRELSDSDEYARLKADHLAAKERLSESVDAAREGGDFEDLFVELPRHPPEEDV
jgi:DNA-binding response OmpR family regulator